MKWLSLFFLFIFITLDAREPYHARVTVSTEQARVSAPNLVDLSRDLRTSAIQKLAPIYTPTSAVSIGINLRGLIANTAFAANSTNLVVSIPNAGIVTSFDGGSRDNSILLFKEYIRDAARNQKLLRAYAKNSPIDPIAGNPNSLMAQMANADYQLGKLSPLTGCCRCFEAQPLVHQFQAGLYAGRSFSKQFDTTAVTLPLRYSYSQDLDAAFIIDAPLTYIRNGGASSVIGSIGFAIRLPVTKNWSLTSLARMGSGGTLDLCTSGNFVSAAIMSVYNHKIREFVLSMTNYLGFFSSTNLWLTGVNFNYRLQTYVLKNGASLTSCEGICLFNRPVNCAISFVDSYFPTNRLFIKHYDEIEASLIINNVNPNLSYDCLNLGFAYQFGDKGYRGYFLKATYQF